LKSFVSSLFLLLIVGCSNKVPHIESNTLVTTKTHNSVEYKENKSYVFMYRKPAFMFGSATTLEILFDGKRLGTLDNKEGAFLVETEEGRHNYEVFSNTLGERFLQAAGVVTVKKDEKKIIEFDSIYSQVKNYPQTYIHAANIKDIITLDVNKNGTSTVNSLIASSKMLNNQFNYKSAQHNNSNSYALIIGISKYQENTTVEYAEQSAQSFSQLVNITFGVPKENIITLFDEKATSGQLKSKLALVKELAEKEGNIYIYFAGHGVPGKDGNTYILPYDMNADSIHLEPNLQLNNIYKKLKTIEAKHVYVFMDSCFSGKDDSGDLLYKGVAPVLKVNKTKVDNDKITVLSAGSSKDFANDYKKQEQRLFSYFLIKELASGKKNLNEVYKTIRRQVKKHSLMKGIGYKQIPEINGNRDIQLY
jgi:hypothetical protein